MSARQHYEEELLELQHDILRMGGMVEEAILNAVESLAKQNGELAEKVIKDDDLVDAFELAVEDKCVKLIATQQPIAKDLRIVFAALKIVTDLERMADHAVDIAKVTLRVLDEKYIKPLIDIPRMAELAMGMVRDSLDAYIKLDIDLSMEVCQRDDTVDGIYAQIFRELLTYMLEDPKTINQATNFLFVARYLERIADHSTNICEWIIYNVTGEHKDLNA